MMGRYVIFRCGGKTDPLDAPTLLAGCDFEASPASGTQVAPTRVKESRSCVGRLVKCCATRTARTARNKL